VATAQNQMDFLASRRFAVAFLDEASQLLEPQIVGLLTLTEKAVLIGDPKQLPAVVVQPPEDSALEDPELEGLELRDRREAYFERLLRLARLRGWADTHTGMLRHQGRMHPAVAEWPNRRYYGGRLLAVGVAHQRREGPVHPLPAGDRDALLDALCRHRVLWIDSTPVPEDRSYRVNSGEARTVADVLERWIHILGLPPEETGVITPYRQQIQTIRAELDRRLPEQASRVLVDTVERFQGSQRKAILYSFSVNDPMQLHTLTSSLYEADGQPAVDRKLNVALTRAREQVVLIGNRRVLGRNEAFTDLMAHAVAFEGTGAGIAYGEGALPARAADDGGLSAP
jgi:DNA replication ATP-dependent helicase Dna2